MSKKKHKPKSGGKGGEVTNSGLQYHPANPKPLPPIRLSPHQLKHRNEGLQLDYEAEFVADASPQDEFKPKAEVSHLLTFPKLKRETFCKDDFPTLTYGEHAKIRKAILASETGLDPAIEKKLNDIYTKNKELVVLSMSGGEPQCLSGLYLRVCMQTRCIRFMRSDQIMIWATSMDLYRGDVRDEDIELLKIMPQYRAKQSVVNFAPLRDKYVDVACDNVAYKFRYSSEKLGAAWVRNHQFYTMVEAIKQVVFSDGLSSPLNRLLDKYQQVLRIQDTLRLSTKMVNAGKDASAANFDICRLLEKSRQKKDPKELGDAIIHSFSSWANSCRSLSAKVRQIVDKIPPRDSDILKGTKDYESRFYTTLRTYGDVTLDRMSKWVLDKDEKANRVHSRDMLNDIYEEDGVLKGKVFFADGSSLEAYFSEPTEYNILGNFDTNLKSESSLLIENKDFSVKANILHPENNCVQIPIKEDTVHLASDINFCDFFNGNGIRYSRLNRESNNIPSPYHKTPFTTPFSSFYTPTSFRAFKPLDTILVDITGPFPMSISGYKWLLTILDYNSMAIFSVKETSLRELTRKTIVWLHKVPNSLQAKVRCVQYHGPDSSAAAPFYKEMEYSPREIIRDYCRTTKILMQDYQGMKYSRFHSSSQSERATTQVIEELVLIPARNVLWTSEIRNERLWEYAVDYIVQKHNHTYDVVIGRYMADWGIPPSPYANISMPLLLNGDKKLTRDLFSPYTFGKEVAKGKWLVKWVGNVKHLYDKKKVIEEMVGSV